MTSSEESDMRFVATCASLAALVSGCSSRRSVVPPPDDMIAIPAQTFVGDDTTCVAGTTSARPHSELFRVRLTITAFRIDRHLVTCAEFEQCVSAGACRHENEDMMKCQEGLAAAQRPPATAYCHWRNARLPSWNEWQLAIQGPDGWEYPTGHVHRPEFDYDSEPGGTRYTSPFGVEYLFNAKPFLGDELTRDDDCFSISPDRNNSPVMVGPITGFTVGMIHESTDTDGSEHGAFRCVRD